MAIIELSIIPLGTETPSLSRYVAQAVKILQQEKGIKYELTSMGTIMEGDLGHLLNLSRRMHEAVFGAGVMRAVTVIKIDDRRDKASSMSGKMEALRRELGR